MLLKKAAILLCLLPVAAVGGCTKISEESYYEDIYIPSQTTAAETEETVPEETVFTETESDIFKIADYTESEPRGGDISPRGEPSEDWDPEFYASSLFFGDSICRALSVYSDLIDPERVAAAGGCAARNIHEFTFMLNDIDYDMTSAAADIPSDKIFLWMGMNDINMTEKDEYARNLMNIAAELHTASPDSRLIIIGMSPTASYHEWQANPRIMEFNAAVRDAVSANDTSVLPVSYVDVTDVLSDSDGYLLPECDGGDGMHLSQRAYYRVLSKIYRTFARPDDGQTEGETVQTDGIVSR